MIQKYKKEYKGPKNTEKKKNVKFRPNLSKNTRKPKELE